MNDQLEREIEAALARLATQAVPDAQNPPAPPWAVRTRRVDVRRFGRATPWLVAAVLLVIAGLGIGAAVTFDAGAPDRGPVGTDGPDPGPVVSPDASDTLPTGPAASPSHPPLSRDSNVSGPDDGVSTSPSGPFTPTVGAYGPITAGMTESQAVAAAGNPGTGFVDGPGSCRSLVVPADSGVEEDGAVVFSVDGNVVGILAGRSDEDGYGNGRGTMLAQLRRSYPDGVVAQSSSGWVFSVTDGGLGLGFVLQGGDQTPSDTDPVSGIRAGTADYARGFEVCSG